MAAAAPELLTLRDVARRLRVSETTVRRRIRSGEIPAVRLGADMRNPLRVPADELEWWLFSPGDEAA